MEIHINNKPQIIIRGEGNAPKTLVGYAAVYGVETVIDNSFREVIAKGAFDESLGDGDDIVCRYDHAGMILGRTSSGTLKVTSDNVGLPYDLNVPNTTLGNDLIELCKRGDISKSSFAAMVLEDEWIYADNSMPLRILKKMKLIDVSPVCNPAYTETSVAARSAAFKDKLITVGLNKIDNLCNEVEETMKRIRAIKDKKELLS